MMVNLADKKVLQPSEGYAKDYYSDEDYYKSRNVPRASNPKQHLSKIRKIHSGKNLETKSLDKKSNKKPKK